MNRLVGPFLGGTDFYMTGILARFTEPLSSTLVRRLLALKEKVNLTCILLMSVHCLRAQSMSTKLYGEDVGKLARFTENFISTLVRRLLLKLYLAHVYSLLENSSQVWDPYLKARDDSSERVQKFWLRMSS